MALTLYTGPRTFTENASRQISQAFGSTTRLTCVFEGLEADFERWVPKLGASHPNHRWLFLTSIDRHDSGGGLLEVSLVYAGNDAKSQVSASGVPYTNLQTSVSFVSKSFSWSGVIHVPQPNGTAPLARLDLSIPSTGLEVTFSYTAYAYPQGALFGDLAAGFVKLISVHADFAYSEAAAGTSYTGVITLPAVINPQHVVTNFSCKQASPSTQTNTGHPWEATLESTPGIWDVTETWGLEFNLASLGMADPTYVAATPA